MCWRLRDRGGKIGLSPAAVVWHSRRSSLRAYWQQQRAYGDAEAVVERKWPEKYNAPGIRAGRVGCTTPAPRTHLRRPRDRIRYGTWGTGLFQSVYQPAERTLAHLPLMPEWYLFIVALAAIGAMGALWPPLFLALPLLAAAIGVAVLRAILTAARVTLGPVAVPGGRAA